MPSDRPVDPSALVDDETPGEFDAEKVIKRWRDIKDRGHPLGPVPPGDPERESGD